LKKLDSLIILIFILIFSSFCSHETQRGSSHNAIPVYDISVRILPGDYRIEVTGTWRLPAEKEVREDIQKEVIIIFQITTVHQNMGVHTWMLPFILPKEKTAWT